MINIHLFYANSVDPNQTPRLAASDLGLHCLTLSCSLDLAVQGLSPLCPIHWTHVQ